MIKRAIVAYLGSLANDHTHAVINEHPPADGRARMDLDSRQEAAPVRQPAREPAESRFPEPIGRPAMPDQRMQAGIASEHFPAAARRGVPVEHDSDVFAQAVEHGVIIAFLPDDFTQLLRNCSGPHRGLRPTAELIGGKPFPLSTLRRARRSPCPRSHSSFTTWAPCAVEILTPGERASRLADYSRNTATRNSRHQGARISRCLRDGGETCGRGSRRQVIPSPRNEGRPQQKPLAATAVFMWRAASTRKTLRRRASSRSSTAMRST